MTKTSRKSEDGDPFSAEERTVRNRMLWLLVAAVAVWGGLLALGSYLGIDQQTPSRDIRRFAVMAGSTGIFLAVWVGAILLGKRR